MPFFVSDREKLVQEMLYGTLLNGLTISW